MEKLQRQYVLNVRAKLSSGITRWWMLISFLALVCGCATVDQNLEVKNKKLFELEGAKISVEVILPDSYERSPNKQYPVLYALDAYWTRDSIQKSYRDLLFDNQVQEMIHVSIGYPDDIRSVEDQRMNDLTPRFDKAFKHGGDAQRFLTLINEELVPYIDNNFRTQKNKKILTGHSLAGLFTLYAMYSNPTSFTHYVANSPSALWADEVLADLDSKFADNNMALDTHVFITYGSDEYRPYVAALQKYIQQLKDRKYEGLSLTLESVDGLRHAGMSTQGFLRGILWAFSDDLPSGVSSFEAMHIEAFKNLK